ncbi:MAG: DNA (cytosine-5-)-methyltransferase [Anaerolineae bacterium]|jgi:DNA (cytosine-5)-methyltransferase 1|nr:DNA (cytosine-5-)-methyltransferase [Anaerolineae bacterium]
MIRSIDLFAGVGGIRLAFERAGAQCVFSSEWDKFAQRTYAANHGTAPTGDIRAVASADIPDHELLLAGFPCQPFSISGVSKKNALGRKHGFADEHQGNLFFEIARILAAKQPPAFFLENVKHLQHHDRGRTFRVIRQMVEDLGYALWTQVVDARHYVPQHRERIFMVGLHRQQLPGVAFAFPPAPAQRAITLRQVIAPQADARYTLSDALWQYLQAYKTKHQQRGNGFGYGLIDPERDDCTRTLSARYYKDGAEILVAQAGRNPRRLTPRECARLMGYPDDFIIPVSDTQAYKQFGNSVCVTAVEATARALLPVVQAGGYGSAAAR